MASNTLMRSAMGAGDSALAPSCSMPYLLLAYARAEAYGPSLPSRKFGYALPGCWQHRVGGSGILRGAASVSLRLVCRLSNDGNKCPGNICAQTAPADLGILGTLSSSFSEHVTLSRAVGVARGQQG